jgi:hypothetical protein
MRDGRSARTAMRPSRIGGSADSTTKVTRKRCGLLAGAGTEFATIHRDREPPQSPAGGKTDPPSHRTRVKKTAPDWQSLGPRERSLKIPRATRWFACGLHHQRTTAGRVPGRGYMGPPNYLAPQHLPCERFRVEAQPRHRSGQQVGELEGGAPLTASAEARKIPTICRRRANRPCGHITHSPSVSLNRVAIGNLWADARRAQSWAVLAHHVRAPPRRRIVPAQGSIIAASS